MGVKVLGLGLGVPGFWLRVLGSWSLVPGLEFQVPERFEFRISGQGSGGGFRGSVLLGGDVEDSCLHHPRGWCQTSDLPFSLLNLHLHRAT